MTARPDVALTALATRCHRLLKQAPAMPVTNGVLEGSSSSMTRATSHFIRIKAQPGCAISRPRGPGRVVVSLIQKQGLHGLGIPALQAQLFALGL